MKNAIDTKVSSQLNTAGGSMPKTLRQIFKHEWTDIEDLACYVQDLWKSVNDEGEEYYRHVDCRPKVLVTDVLAIAIPLAKKILSLKTENEGLNNLAQSFLITIKEPPFKYKADIIRHVALQLAEAVLSRSPVSNIVRDDPNMPF